MSANIHPTAIVSETAKLGESVEIGPFCIVDGDVELGDGVRLISHVTISGYTKIGADTVIYPHASLGHPPQDFKYKGEETWLKIGARNTIREYVTMHPGTGVGRKETVIGDDGFFMVGTHVAHDCIVGNKVVLSNHAVLGGYTVVEDQVILGGYTGVVQFCRIGRQAFVNAMSLLTKDVIPYGAAGGNHAHLEGLNLVGLRRRGHSREAIKELRTAYRLMFAEEGSFNERLVDVASLYPDNPAVKEIIQFIRAEPKRSICMPHD
ncbi:acyl-ACP--UDP-N-acetylglucosamine O-acyltransferase [Hyphobacterium sp. CCMP332]|jgi:UDP-N-acetylglucosamine acyltransferase|uniref:acyl-ACP--UDP-N-acetylglucosamine O-acyltransferase n=1 Tax=Hyphobacterium sp. CCMP332 TaxID=2749086 RepID=UPI00164FE2F2|nr:acyl-ACP--UDP-N-acetylglucosamine O-acyltransferase [Hyphobacterium sp. CCMP332]QNL18670.1 acyl-ACP--UDP-N-acetylglucosamine O-acyltransferase [Hyphobacterium sp. CCMP332]